MRPLMIKLSPLANDTVVSVRRTFRAGTEVPAMVIPALKSSSLTSGATLSTMRRLSTTVGVRLSRTPNSLYWIDMESLDVLGTGTGHSPPARQVALWPLRDTRLGCDRV